jgi:hypothetical protein
MAATALAIPLALLTTSAFNAGLIVEKQALSKMPPLQLSRVGQTVLRLLTAPAWLAGLALVVTGLAMQVIILTFEPISLVQPVLASGVVVTLLLSRLVLREKMRGAETWCVAVMAVSLVLLALSQGGASGQSTRAASALPMVAVVVPSLLIGLPVAFWPWRPGARSPATGTSTALYAAIGIGLVYGVSSLSTKGLSAALGGGHAPARLVIGILSSPYLYLLGGCTVAGMLLYQTALQACRASILIPVTNVVSSGYFVVVGTALFHERLPSDPVKLSLRLAGIGAAVLVIVILSRQPAGPPPAARRVPFPHDPFPQTIPDLPLPDTPVLVASFTPRKAFPGESRPKVHS